MKIFIDAGHNYSGSDTGATGNGRREQDITPLIAIKLKEFLNHNGIEVKMSRNAVTDNVSNINTLKKSVHNLDLDQWFRHAK